MQSQIKVKQNWLWIMNHVTLLFVQFRREVSYKPGVIMRAIAYVIAWTPNLLDELENSK